MLRFVSNPNWDYVLEMNDVVRFKVDGDDALVVYHDCGLYVCMPDAILSGCRPDVSVRDEISSILNWEDISGWQLPTEYRTKTISQLIEWFLVDCNDLEVDDIECCSLIGSEGILTPESVERKEFILKEYTDNRYTGLHSYHYSHGVTMNTPIKPMKEGQYRIGVELEIEATSTSNRNNINKVASNWFFQETDSSLGRNGIELVTIPLLPKDAMSDKTWAPLVDYLKPIARSYDCSSCGLHIHFGREAFGKDEDERQATLGKLLYLYYEYLKPTDWNTKVFGRRHTYNESEFRCKESEAVKVLGEELMSDKKIRDKVDKGLKQAAERTRYYDINVQNAHTIEFRKGKGSICTERIIAIITYCDIMIRYCRKRDWMGLSAEDFLSYIRKTASKSSPLFRYLPTSGEE